MTLHAAIVEGCEYTATDVGPAELFTAGVAEGNALGGNEPAQEQEELPGQDIELAWPPGEPSLDTASRCSVGAPAVHGTRKTEGS